MRRTFLFACCLCAVALGLYSCSMHAQVTTDGNGRVIEVSSVRLESSLARVAVAMLVVGGQVAVELRWLRSLTAGSGDALGG